MFDADAGIALDGTFVKVVAWYDNECLFEQVPGNGARGGEVNHGHIGSIRATSGAFFCAATISPAVPGILYAASAYIVGPVPLVLQKHVAQVNALEVVMHRTVWSLAFVLLVPGSASPMGVAGPVLHHAAARGITFALSVRHCWPATGWCMCGR